MTQLTGSCHCGNVRYSTVLDLTKEVLECNCSYCSRNGLLLSFVPKNIFTLKSGENDMTEYWFNKHKIRHLFCKKCGVQCFAEGHMPDGSEMRAINVRTIDDIDLTKLHRKAVDGKSF